MGQPYGVWHSVGFPGLLGIFILCPIFLLIRKRYHEAEERRIQAEDCRPHPVATAELVAL
jgi:hypothetical protein